MQDYVTMKKRQIIAKTYNATPPPGARKNNAVYLSAVANNASQRERRVYAFQGAQGGASGGVSWDTRCCLSNNGSSAFGAFSTVTDKGIVRFNVIPPMSVRATTVTS